MLCRQSLLREPSDRNHEPPPTACGGARKSQRRDRCAQARCRGPQGTLLPPQSGLCHAQSIRETRGRGTEIAGELAAEVERQREWKAMVLPVRPTRNGV